MSVAVAVVCEGRWQWAIGADRMWTARGEAPSYQDKVFQIAPFAGAFAVAGHLGACQLFARKMALSTVPDLRDRLYAVWEEMAAHPTCRTEGAAHTGMYALHCAPGGIMVLDPYGGISHYTDRAAIGTGGPVALGAVACQPRTLRVADVVTLALSAAISVLPHECGGPIQIMEGP